MAFNLHFGNTSDVGEKNVNYVCLMDLKRLIILNVLRRFHLLIILSSVLRIEVEWIVLGKGNG